VSDDITGHTEREKSEIDRLLSADSLPLVCPNGHFWMRDYGYPIRACPVCGAPKPWASAANSYLWESVEKVQ